jgi:hypothetical protein
MPALAGASGKSEVAYELLFLFRIAQQIAAVRIR